MAERHYWINNYPREILDFCSAGRALRTYLTLCGLYQAVSLV